MMLLADVETAIDGDETTVENADSAETTLDETI